MKQCLFIVGRDIEGINHFVSTLHFQSRYECVSQLVCPSTRGRLALRLDSRIYIIPTVPICNDLDNNCKLSWLLNNENVEILQSLGKLSFENDKINQHYVNSVRKVYYYIILYFRFLSACLQIFEVLLSIMSVLCMKFA